MIKKYLTKILWFVGRNTRIHSINRILLEKSYKDLIAEREKNNSFNLVKFGFKVYSQNDEDGIIDEIFNRIGIKNKSFIELGVQDGLECNTTYLLMSGWKGLWIDMSTNKKIIEKNFSDFYNKRLFFKQKKITKENVNSLLGEHINFVGEDVDLLSIDLSRNTYHILNKIDICKPRVIVAEYNAKLRDKIQWKCDYDENLEWDGSDQFSASLKSFELMLNKKNYYLVGCNITGVNAFFVRKDLINEKFLKDYSSEVHYEEFKGWLIKKFENELKVSI